VKRILILGGYGGFGARLSRRLAGDGHHILVAGRRLAEAQKFCEKLPNTQAVQADRNTGFADLLKSIGPDLVIDAAGPFQNSSYHVVEACIAERIAYLDLADAREFVCGIQTLDAAAKRVGIAVIAGASSVPALSGAVIRKLADGLDQVSAIEMAISASNRATAGPSVASAILSYVGKSVRVWRGKRWTDAYGWQELKRQSFAVDGHKPITRLVALADIPDHQIVPTSVSGAPAVIFRAGPEFAFQTLSLWLLSWLVRWGLLRSIAPLAGWLRHLQGVTAKLGSDRSAMVVSLKGYSGNEIVERCWTLIAENGDGPEIPTLAAQLLANAILKGRVGAGARTAADALTLGQFEPLFSKLAIAHQTTEKRYAPVYKRAMGDAFDMLPTAVRKLHLLGGDGGASGSATVTRGSNPLARLIGWFMRFPPAGEHQLQVSFSERDGVEHWTRAFSGRRFASHLSERDGKLTERFGPLRFYFDLPSDTDGLQMVMRRWSAFGISLPLAFAPKSPAREWQDGDDFCFDVPISLPLIGLVVHYNGKLRLTA
jgi:NAD(P)-dependent dehydrogenase (short-subunit alcohol dehydrogenase family)